MYFPKLEHPNMSNDIIQMRSNAKQVPFFFGASQIPSELKLPRGSYSGSGFKNPDDRPKHKPIFIDGERVNNKHILAIKGTSLRRTFREDNQAYNPVKSNGNLNKVYYSNR